MSTINKMARRGFFILSSIILLFLAGGCDDGKIEGVNQELARLKMMITEVQEGQNVVSFEAGQGVSVNCSKHQQDGEYAARVIFEGGCPAAVEFPGGHNGCFPGPVAGDPQPPVCLCIAKNEKVTWQAYSGDDSDAEFTVHFSPFEKGSFESKKGLAESGKLESLGKVPGNSLVAFKYSISAGPDCTVLDPPFIVKK